MKKTIFLSVLGHITVFSIFSFSFNNRIIKTNYADVYFWGATLYNYDLAPDMYKAIDLKILKIKDIFTHKINKSISNILNKDPFLPSNYYLKPNVVLLADTDKITPTVYLDKTPFIPKKKEQTIMFYPNLPYHFLLYFKDRQAAHIELLFNIESLGKTNYITIKRKISSGNLEADLLAMRYIKHYLFIQQAGLIKNTWQTVKIDLSAKD